MTIKQNGGVFGRNPTFNDVDVEGDLTSATIDLAAIATSKAVTAVDVFVYDTSKDSDGGAWRKRTQGTSWYNETLDSATRGSRKEFPAVAVIVAEAAKVTIYDGDDPSLPMWMVFNKNGTGSSNMNMIGGSASSISSISVKGGVLVTGSLATWGVIVTNFASDSSNFYYTAKTVQKGTISQRNDGLGYAGSAVGLVNDSVNDVAMTVLPNAPIDPATGLPVPTIAVATDGGVSVIKDDGTVVDLTYTISSNEAGKVWFPLSGGIAWTSRVELGGYVYVYRENEIPASDKSTQPSSRYGNFTYTPSVSDLTFVGDTNVDAVEGVVASNDGVTFVDENPTTPANGMVAYTTSTYNTGWMNGDIKGAFLSDTDDTDLVGAELVTNGTFDTDISGWTASDAGCSLSLVSNQLRITNNDATAGGAVTSFSVVSGEVYTFSVGTSSGTVELYLGNEPNTATYFGLVISNSTTWTSTVTGTVYFMVKNASGTNGATIDIDNISVRLAEADRSVNGNGLQVFGTITKTAVATGAELMKYSGFSASNYLEQPYNSDLDFGTGDFSIMGWVKTNSTGWVATRFDTSSYGFGLFGAATTLSFKIGPSASANDLTTTVPSGVWLFVSISRSSGTLSMSVNGSVVSSAANTDTVNGSGDAAFNVGAFGGVSSFAGSLALLRISATAPTAEQIEKIYNDEKFLFQENAGAVLAGTSDAVTALAYDDDTQELLVGTSQNTSVFRGLRRVETISGSASAISASNGLRVIED